MKTIKAILLAIAVMVSIGASAQLPFSIGIKGGANLSNLSGDLKDTSSRGGFNAGLFARLSIPMTGFYVASGAEITTKGAKYKDEGLEIKANPMYLQIPLHVGYKISLIPTTRLLIHAGPYWAYGLSGKVKAEGEKIDFFSDDFCKKNDFGLGVGLGAEFWKFGVDVGYDFGLTNISQNSDFKVNNRNAYLSFSYRFM